MAKKAPQDTKPSKGYGQRPMWQWLVIYLIIAAIVYTIVYFVFIRESGNGGFGY